MIAVERHATQALIAWKSSRNRKPLILKGARQVGKTWLMKEFGKTYYDNTAYFNFDETDDLRAIFETSKDPHRIIELLSMIADEKILPEKTLIILDEILKGTNSMDKQKGSFALIKQFMTLQANGIIATHDLLLGTLIDLFPDDIRNYRFEADITDNELTFSYRLRPGIAQNMNACFLMKKMGIAVAD